MQSREHLSENLGIALSGRDNPPEMPVIGGRAQRAFRNLGEALVVFLPLALLLEIAGDIEPLAVQAGWAFIGLRVLYVPAYLSAIKGLRSAVWMLAVGALGVMGGTLL